MNYSRRNFFQTLAASALCGAATGADAPKKNMIVRSTRPMDLEMPLDGFTTFLTPVERFYVRSHHYTPEVNLAEWKLQLDGLVEHPLSLTMEDLKKLPRVEMVGVIECAGNGRGFYEPPVPGVQWTYGSVGNAKWAGVRLADVLAKAQVKAGTTNLLMDGADVPVGTMPEFQRTLPLKKAMDRDTMLAYEMNGVPLPVANGFPLRLVVPGWAGDSWVKWLTGIKAIDKDFDGFFMKTAYRHPGKAVAPGTAVDPALMHPVESLVIKSVIATPVDGARVPVGPVKVQGVAWSGEKPVVSVEVSIDRGRTWRKAELGRDQARYGWRLWQYSFTPPQPGYYTVMSRAFDSAGMTQPMAQEWNPSGYLHNVVPQVGIEVSNEPKPEVAASAPPTVETSKVFRQSCSPCHEEDIVKQQRLTRGQWDREIDKMTRWGAKVNPNDRSELLEYLVKQYGPRPRK